MNLTPKEAKWLKLVNDAFSNSTTYLDSHLRSQWEDNIRMYNNKHVKKSRFNTEMYKKRSNIFRPKTRSSGMSFEASVASAFFSTMDLVNITAENPQDPAQGASAKIAKNLLQFRLSKTIPWVKLTLGAAHEAWKMGVCISKQYWNTEIDKPVIQLIPPENFRIDASADWLDPLNSSPYTIHIIPTYIQDLKQWMKSATKIPWLKLDKGTLKAARDSSSDSLRMSRENQKQDPKKVSKPISDHDMVFVRETVMRKDGKEWLVYSLGENVLLSKPIELKVVYKHGRPYTFGSLLIEPFKVYKTGMPELGQPLQEEINYVANDRIDNVHLVLNKRYFAKRGRNVDYRSLLRNIPGSITMMDNPMEDVQVVPTVDITQSAYAEQDRLNLDYDELIGNFSSGSAQSNSKMNETVGGMGMVQNPAGQVTEYLLRNFIESWVEPTLYQLVKLEQEYETDETILAIAGNKELVALNQKFGTSTSIDELLENSLSLNVNVGISATNPQMRVERFMFAMNSISAILGSPTAGMLDIKEVIGEVFGQLGYKDGARFFAALNENQDPRLAQMAKQLQQMQQVIQSKQIEQQAKYKIEREKLQVEIQKQALAMEVAKREMAKDETQAMEIQAKTRKLDAETQIALSGSKDGIEYEKIRLEYAKLQENKEIELRKLQTGRDKIMAEWEQTREELDAKLKITLANAKQPSNNIVDLATKTKETTNA